MPSSFGDSNRVGPARALSKDTPKTTLALGETNPLMIVSVWQQRSLIHQGLTVAIRTDSH